MNYDMRIETLPQTHGAVATETIEITGISAFIGEALGLVMQALQRQHVFPVGPPFARYHMLGDRFAVSAGFPVAQPITPDGRVLPIELPGGETVVTMHVGDYAGVSAAYDEMMAWLPTQHLAPAGDPWETYLDGPEVAQPRTRIHLPVRPA